MSPSFYHRPACKLAVPLRQVTFASSNTDKFLEAKAILSSFGIEVRFAQMDLTELQSDSLAEIAEGKAKAAHSRLRDPVFVEDDGLFIDSLKGFPGQYSSFVFQTIGNNGILKLLAGTADRSASFRSIIAYFDGRALSISEGNVRGKISKVMTEGGWGYDPIFIPDGSSLTFAQLAEQKSAFSHRRKGLERFAQWLLGHDDSPRI